MKTVFLSDLELDGEISRGYMTLIGSTGIHYRTPALNIPGYGWIPCSRKLKNFMTTDPDELLLVISGEDDNFRPVTSDIWVTRTAPPQTAAIF